MKNIKPKINKNYSVWKNRLNLITFLSKIKLLETLEAIVKKFNANRYVKKYDRGKVIAMFLIAIIIGSNGYRLTVEDHIYCYASGLRQDAI